MTDESLPPYAWYENFFKDRVLTKVCEDMGECDGFLPYMAEQAPELYARIKVAENELDSLWLSRADKESFKAACKSWYNLLMEAKKGHAAYKAKKLEAALNVGRQEALAIR